MRKAAREMTDAELQERAAEKKADGTATHRAREAQMELYERHKWPGGRSAGLPPRLTDEEPDVMEKGDVNAFSYHGGPT